eukprot:gene23908-9476_t
MQRESDSFISNNDKAFILKALHEEHRLDGRRPYDFRKVKFQFSLDDSSTTVTLGTTRVMTVITAVLEAPYPDRPSEGSMRFNAELSPMASAAFEPGRPSELAMEITRLLERGLKQSGAVDMEALCVMAGRKVWALRVDTHVLDHGGNLLDACFLSALAALLAFRKPEVSVGNTGPNGTTQLVVHPPEVKEPVPLTIHHLPLSVTFALFDDGNLIAVDPTLKEEASMQGATHIMVNPNKEVCAVHKAGGVGLSNSQFLRCVRLACTKVEELVSQLKKALEQHEVARVQARVRRHKQDASISSVPLNWGQSASRSVSVVASDSKVKAIEQIAKGMGIPVKEEACSSGSSSEDEEEEEGDVAMEEAEKKASIKPRRPTAPGNTKIWMDAKCQNEKGRLGREEGKKIYRDDGEGNGGRSPRGRRQQYSHIVVHSCASSA